MNVRTGAHQLAHTKIRLRCDVLKKYHAPLMMLNTVVTGHPTRPQDLRPAPPVPIDWLGRGFRVPESRREPGGRRFARESSTSIGWIVLDPRDGPAVSLGDMEKICSTVTC